MSFWEFFFLLLIYVPMVMLWLFALTDLSGRADISGVAKGLWAVAIVLLPIIGMIIYFITRPDDPEMQPTAVERVDEIAEESQARSTVDELEKLATLHDSGTLSDEEFASAKAKLLETP